MTLRKVLDDGKPKICKCGHGIDQHIGQWYQKKACEMCECDYFVRHERPNKSDWAHVVVEGFLIVFVIGVLAISPDNLSSLPIGIKIGIDLGLACLAWICVSLTKQNLYMKKREVKTL